MVRGERSTADIVLPQLRCFVSKLLLFEVEDLHGKGPAFFHRAIVFQVTGPATMPVTLSVPRFVQDHAGEFLNGVGCWRVPRLPMQ